ncbi:MAG: nucleotidyltransferase family protein, partial [Candidatus Binatia bacterium]
MAAANSSIRIRDYLRNAKRIDLDDAATLIEAWAASRNDLETLADVARARNVVGFVRGVLDEADGPEPPAPELMAALALRRRALRLPVETLLDVFDHVRRELARTGIPTLLLKGLSFGGRLYGSLDHRPQFDVDVLVPRRQLRRAVRALLRSGFAKSDYDMHSRTLVRNGIKVDVHGSLRWAPAYRLIEDDLWADVREVTIAGRPVPTLSDEHTLLMLIVSSFEDLGQGTAKLKQLLDFY